MRRWVGAAAVLAAAAVAGCADGEAKRYRVSGTVTFGGDPIPYGEVLFTPDGSRQNSGPQGIAYIRDGRYDTGADGGKGVAGGPMIVRVTGFRGPEGKGLICEVELPADLPRADGTYDILVPKEAAAKGPKGSDI